MRAIIYSELAVKSAMLPSLRYRRNWLSFEMLLVNALSRFSGFYYDDSGLANVTFLIKILSENVVIKTNG